MSRTLFFYIFKDLLRIFVLTSGALAGIMSFGGLLQPVTQHGLDAGQAARILSYFMPAMTTYSLPVAALFATTMVYGRLSADNEIVACRAAGISFGVFRGVALPALVFGLITAILSLLFLCFVVPVFTLKVERVIYSNLAKLIANEIERTHQIKFQQDTTIFAQQAAVGEEDPKHPQEQAVNLSGLMIISYDKEDAPKDKDLKLPIPRDFYLAKQATVFIRRSKKGDDFTMEARLIDGSVLPRRFDSRNASEGGVGTTTYGPLVMNSMIKEDTKFMDIFRLHELYRDLRQSRRVQEQTTRIARARQEATLLKSAQEKLKDPGGSYEFDSGSERFEVINLRGSAVVTGTKLIVGPAVRVIRKDADGHANFTAEASEVQISSSAISDDRMAVQLQLRDVVAEGVPREGYAPTTIVKAPITIAELEGRGLTYFLKSPEVSNEEKMACAREWLKIGNGIVSEVHARISFAVSCLVLVVVGAYLGMMFKSGNFLSAFALSVIPALVCIALIVAGQHTATNIPYKISTDFQSPLKLGLVLIWLGNGLTVTIAGILISKMQRQ